MALKANYEFLFVGKDDNSFLENYSYDLFEQFGQKSGQIFVTLEVQNNPADAEEIGQEIFDTMQAEFFKDVEIDPYDRFEHALKEVNKALKKFRAEKKSGYIGNLSVVIVAILGDTLYLTQCGEAEAYLVRKRYVSIISEGLNDEAPEEGDTFTNIANGKIEAGDFVLFSSTRILRYISKNDLTRCLSKKNVVTALAEVKDVISAEILGRIGLTGIVFAEATDEELATIPDTVDTVTKSLLEASQTQVEAKRETLTGRFFAALKNRKKGKAEVFQGEGTGIFSQTVSGVGSFFKNLFSGGGFGKDKILIALVGVIVVLGIGIFIVKGNTAEQEEMDRLNQVLIDVQDKIAEAETKSSFDKEAAKQILDKAYSDSMLVLNSGYYRQKAQTFLVQIEETRDNLDNVQRISGKDAFIDLTAKRSDVNALGMVAVGDRVFVYEYNALYEMVLNQVQDPLTIDDEETVISATGFDDRASVVFLTKTGKLIEFREGTMSFMDTDDGSFRKASAIEDWSNRIYLLSATDSQIWRYTYKGTQAKFGAGEAYLADATDILGATDLAIDASVYVLSGDGEIVKLYGGNKAELKIDNEPFSKLTDPAVIHTTEKLSELYVLDSKGNRIFVYTKKTDGNLAYKMQYVFEDVPEIRDLYVDAMSKKMYVLTPSKVLEVAL